ncbi:MAG: RHS repeat-associated core domain-containing protein, partial [Bacteroidota bacterium]|nr:RHS repeat-associated core domain-containing protein [Bacteroidota bacterium]
ASIDLGSNLARVKYMVKNPSDGTFMFINNTKVDADIDVEFIATTTTADIIFQRADATSTNLLFYLDNVKVEEIGESYRYGFNGMEKDDEVKGTGNHYTTHFRQYEPRFGRWFSIDPLVKNFPWQSPYVAFDNSPIYKNDPRGDAAKDPPKEIKKEEIDKIPSDGTRQEFLKSVFSLFNKGDYIKNDVLKELIVPSPTTDKGKEEEFEGYKKIRKAFDPIKKLKNVEKKSNGDSKFQIEMKNGKTAYLSVPIVNETDEGSEIAMTIDLKIENNASVSVSTTSDGWMKINFNGISVGKGILRVGMPNVYIKGDVAKILGIKVNMR